MSKPKRLERILFIPDVHIPYHDRRAFDLMLKAAKEFKPDHVIIMGDFVDFYSVSSHSKDPSRALKLEMEIAEAKKELRRIKKLGAKSYVFLGGNHEDRLTRYLCDKAPELSQLISIPSVLELDKLGFTYVPYKEHYKLGKLYITHDTGQAGQYAVFKALAAFQHSVIIGHIHRVSYQVEGDAEGQRHLGACFGWLGDINTVDYLHKIRAAREWGMGFGIGYLNDDTKFVYVVPVPIVEYTVVIEGQFIKN